MKNYTIIIIGIMLVIGAKISLEIGNATCDVIPRETKPVSETRETSYKAEPWPELLDLSGYTAKEVNWDEYFKAKNIKVEGKGLKTRLAVQRRKEIIPESERDLTYNERIALGLH